MSPTPSYSLTGWYLSHTPTNTLLDHCFSLAVCLSVVCFLSVSICHSSHCVVQQVLSQQHVPCTAVIQDLLLTNFRDRWSLFKSSEA